jgi:hypothetical protein
VGCTASKKDDPSKGGPDPKAQSAEDAEVAEALAQLSAEDRTAAEEQKVCPVTDERLGSMGKPFKVTVEGQDVFLCCKGCEETIKADPQTYLSKLKKG